MKNNELRIVIMEQVAPCRWQIVNKQGYKLMEDIMIGIYDQAEDFVKAYISSYGDVSYIMKPLKEKL
jgi:hypothetical protein